MILDLPFANVNLCDLEPPELPVDPTMVQPDVSFEQYDCFEKKNRAVWYPKFVL